MALSNPFNPPPNTPLLPDPQRDSVWRRWFEQLWRRIQTGALGGTVTSVGLSLPTSVFDVTGSPVTTSGTLAATFDTQSANTAFMGPTTGAAATPAFRALVAADIPTNTPITVGVTPIASGTATRVLYEGAGNLLAEDADLTFDGTTLTAGGLSVTGDTTLGDASGDALTVNAGAWTLGNNVVMTRTAGTIAAGTLNFINYASTYTANSGGTSGGRALRMNIQLQGANNASENVGLLTLVDHTGSGTVTNQIGLQFQNRLTSSGTITLAEAIRADNRVSGSGAITTSYAFSAEAPVITGGGSIGTHIGLNVANPGSASITTFYGVRVVNINNSTTMSAVKLEMNSGSGKKNLDVTGTADNVIAGNTRFGSTTAPTVALDVTGAAKVSSTLVVTGAASNAVGNTASSTTNLNLAAGTTSASSIRLPHGSAPTSPVDGDMWTTTAGLFVRINGVTVGPLS